MHVCDLTRQQLLGWMSGFTARKELSSPDTDDVLMLATIAIAHVNNETREGARLLKVVRQP
jgi:hypothetical protein